MTSYEDPSWEPTAAMWNFVTPWGLKKLCVHISQTYQSKNGIIITENGSSWPDQSKDEGIKDVKRIDFFEQYLTGVHEAIQEGADVRGYGRSSTTTNGLEDSTSVLDLFGWTLILRNVRSRTLRHGTTTRSPRMASSRTTPILMRSHDCSSIFRTSEFSASSSIPLLFYICVFAKSLEVWSSWVFSSNDNAISRWWLQRSKLHFCR